MNTEPPIPSETRKDTVIAEVESKSAPATVEKKLTEKETLDQITPFAFRLDKKLIGLPLAGPARRGLALGIDGIVVVLLQELPEEILALMLAWFSFVAMRRYSRQASLRKWVPIYACSLGLCLLTALGMSIDRATDFFGESDGSSTIVAPGADQALSFAELPQLISGIQAIYQASNAGECGDLPCYQERLKDLPAAAKSLGMDEDSATEFFNTVITEATLQPIEKQQLLDQLLEQFTQIPEGGLANNTAEAALDQRLDQEGRYSVIGFFEDLLRDFGLGFGWAAFYFTVMIAWFDGKTFGKRLFGIQVIRLDGKPLSLWDSFGRYGGYGAGIATGLLGFIQIYWDPNRQAIHDKITGTVVIRDKSKGQ